MPYFDKRKQVLKVLFLVNEQNVYVMLYTYNSALLWQKEASHEFVISRNWAKMCLSYTLISMQCHAVLT